MSCHILGDEKRGTAEREDGTRRRQRFWHCFTAQLLGSSAHESVVARCRQSNPISTKYNRSIQHPMNMEGSRLLALMRVLLSLSPSTGGAGACVCINSFKDPPGSSPARHRQAFPSPWRLAAPFHNSDSCAAARGRSPRQPLPLSRAAQARGNLGHTRPPPRPAVAWRAGWRPDPAGGISQ